MTSNKYDESEDFFADDVAPEAVEVKTADFVFNRPQTIDLPNGTKHYFGIPTLNNEKRKEQLTKTVILTMTEKIDGNNKKTVTTDYTKGQLAYYLDTIHRISGFAFNETDNPETVLDARKVIGKTESRRGMRDQLLCELIPSDIQKAAVGKLYSGKLEIIKPETAGSGKAVIVLNQKRQYQVRFSLGVETNDDGTTSKPFAIVDFFFDEPTSWAFSKWETQAFDGFSVALKDGGQREERTYNLEGCLDLFNHLINRMTGASIEEKTGEEEFVTVPCDVRIKEHLEAIPFSIRKQTVAFLMNEVIMNAGK